MPTDGRDRLRRSPWEVARDVFCLGPTGRTQTNVYFVRSGAIWVLVDAGWPADGPGIAAAAADLLGPGVAPAAILLTHHHPDHAGAAATLARQWASPVHVHGAELAIAVGDFGAMRQYAGPLDRWFILPVMRAIGPRRRQVLIARSSLKGLVRALQPGEPPAGLAGWEWIHTPGHTPGHVSFFRPDDRVAITGDAIVTLKVNSPAGLLGRQGISGPPRYTSWDWSRAKVSVATLAALEPTVIASGHGVPCSGSGSTAALRAFADHVRPDRRG